jgi:GT2 family glycosyltransferase
MISNEAKSGCGTARLDDLSVVVLSYNRREELLFNLSGLCELHRKTGAELIVVDNNSSDGTRADLKNLSERMPTVKIIFSEANLGVAGGRNTGWAAATRKYILNLDDDTRIDIVAIMALRAAALRLPHPAILTPKVIHALTGECQNGYGDDVTEAANFHGACHLVPAEVWNAVGRIDPLCTFGGEELDYSIRARALGYPTMFVANALARHNSLPRQGAAGAWRRRRWIYNFSRIYFKHFPIRYASVFIARFLLAQLASAASSGEATALPSLVYHALRGTVNGRRAYVPLPRLVVAFYADGKLSPDFGNRPIVAKLIARFARGS